MYDYLEGKLIEENSLYVVLGVGGIGFKLFIPINLSRRLPAIGQQVILYTTLIVRENFQALYGFISKGEREMFERLVALSGIGPKTALGIIGHLELNVLAEAVRSNNIVLLSKVPGIGKKTAERLIIDLKGKLEDLPLSGLEKQPFSLQYDALHTLMNLGFSQSLAEKAVRRAMEEFPEVKELSLVIAAALKSGQKQNI